MALVRIILVLAALGFGAMIVAAGLNANIVESFSAVAADPWGMVSLADLYLGFLAFAVLVWLLEPDIRFRLFVIVLMPVLGNFLALLWLAWRLPAIAGRLARR